MKSICISILSILLFTSLIAQDIPSTIKYQAVIRDANGKVMANKDVKLTITINQSGSQVSYREVHDVTTNAFGLANLEIGSKSEADFMALPWSEGGLSLLVDVDNQLISESKILTVPYALHAKTVDDPGISYFNNDIGYLLSEVDGDTLNEIQKLSVSGSSSPVIILSQGDSIKFKANGSTTLSQENKTITITSSNIFSGDYNDLANKPLSVDPNILIGYDAGKNVTNNPRIIAIGEMALQNNTNGNNNIALGNYALQQNTLGSSNIAIGLNALMLNSTGNYNVGIGDHSLVSNTEGNYNTGVGYRTLFSNYSGSNNTAYGSFALQNNFDGYNNTATGWSALEYNNSGSSNTANGGYTLQNNTTGNYNTAMGEWAAVFNSTGNNNTAIGYNAMAGNSTGHSNTAVGSGSGVQPGPGAVNISNTCALGAGASVTASNTARIGNYSITEIGGAVAWSNLSDGRFKTNVNTNIPGLDFILKLRPVTYTWDLKKLNKFNGNDKNNKEVNSEKENKVYTGFIAQEVELAAKESSYDFSAVIKPANEKSIYKLSYAEFVVPLVKAVQEQQKVIIELQEENKNLEKLASELEALKAEMKAIKELIK